MVLSQTPFPAATPFCSPPPVLLLSLSALSSHQSEAAWSPANWYWFLLPNLQAGWKEKIKNSLSVWSWIRIRHKGRLRNVRKWRGRLGCGQWRPRKVFRDFNPSSQQAPAFFLLRELCYNLTHSPLSCISQTQTLSWFALSQQHPLKFNRDSPRSGDIPLFHLLMPTVTLSSQAKFQILPAGCPGP